MTQKKTNKHVNSERTVRTYVYADMAAFQALEYAEASEEGQLYNVIVVITFCAFTLEAYLNHVGATLLPAPDWARLKWRSSDEKRDVIAARLGLELDLSRRPFQSFKEIFRFRNDLAHGCTVTMKGTREHRLGPGERPPLPDVRWEKLCTLETARRLFADMEDIVVAIHQHVDPNGHPFMSLADASWSSTELPTPPPTTPQERR